MSFPDKNLVGNETIYLTDFTLFVSALAHMRFLVNPHPLFFPGRRNGLPRPPRMVAVGWLAGWLAGWLVGVGGGRGLSYLSCLFRPRGEGRERGEEAAAALTFYCTEQS